MQIYRSDKKISEEDDLGYQTLITTDLLAHSLHAPGCVILDCRFSLADADYGSREYASAHIPGAIYAHLDIDLCGPMIKGVTGRHPLPSPVHAEAVFSRWGIEPGVQVVAYDDQAGALAAARAWWLLRWLGHMDAAVLDGGWQAWSRTHLPVKAGIETGSPGQFRVKNRPDLVVTAEQVNLMRLDPAFRLFDSRLPERYAGIVEPIDPVAGHIPGAYSAPYSANLTSEGTFQTPENLRVRFERLLEGVPAERSVFYCGSGVTATHNILAMQHAGLGEARLYAGSWSEWIVDRQRPIAVGEQPASDP